MNYNIVLHKFENGSSIIVNPQNIAYMENVFDEDEKVIATTEVLKFINDNDKPQW